MANLADIVVEETSDTDTGNPDGSVRAESDTGESGTGTRQSASTVTDPLELELSTDAVPEKFRGKKLRDVLESYSSLESRYGTMANELGVQRQLTDRLLDLKRSDDLARNTPPATRKPPQVTASDILDKPAETLDRVLSERDAAITEAVNRRLAAMQMQTAEQTFKSRHSDFQTIVSDPSFGDWVRSSPIRMRAASAANSGDWAIASELLDEYKASRRAASTAAPTQAKPSADIEGARRATLESSTGGSGNDGTRKGKTYSRRELMRKRIEDPDGYYDDAFQAEILKAYQEKRITD